MSDLQEGGVFTFGAGMFGQLGHNAPNSETLPKKVFELMGSEVSQLVCGRLVKNCISGSCPSCLFVALKLKSFVFLKGFSIIHFTHRKSGSLMFRSVGCNDLFKLSLTVPCLNSTFPSSQLVYEKMCKCDKCAVPP